MRISSRLFVLLCSCVLHTRSLFWSNTKSKSVKKSETRKEQNFSLMFFPPPSPKKRKKCGHRKCRPKGTQVTKGQRTDKSLISLFVSRMHLFTVLLPGRKEDTESPVRRRRGESSLLRVSLGMCALEMVVLFHQSARARRRKRASAQKGRKTNKQTKDGGTKNLKKVPTWHFSASKARQTFRGLTRRLFTKK